MFPSQSLAELVRAMKLKSRDEEGGKEDSSVHHQHQLPSIVETDPAVARAVRSAEPFYPQPMMPQVSYNITWFVAHETLNMITIINCD